MLGPSLGDNDTNLGARLAANIRPKLAEGWHDNAKIKSWPPIMVQD